MRTIKTSEYTEITGGYASGGEMLIIAGASLAGAFLTGSFVSVMGPLATFVGTPATAVGFGLVCTPFAPVVGTIGCGFVGGVAGYYLSASCATAFGVVAGGVGSGLLAAYYII